MAGLLVLILIAPALCGAALALLRVRVEESGEQRPESQSAGALPALQKAQAAPLGSAGLLQSPVVQPLSMASFGP